jgi:hypothetical protein
MKERLKMIFDRIDIFVVCIILGLCLCIVEAFIGNWDVSADCAIMVFLVSEVCYTNRCNEKLEIELIEAKEKLKEAKGKVMELQHEVIAEQEKYNHWIDVNGKYFKIVQLCRDLWEERYCLEEAKVLLCKKKLTTGGFLEQIKTHEEAIADIENKIRQANIEYKKFRNQH